MSVKDNITIFLMDHGLKFFEESEFVRENREPISTGGVACRYPVSRAKEPDVDSQAVIKVFMRSPELRILAEEARNKEFAQEKTWQYFKRECCIFKLERSEEHQNIQKCLGVVNGFAGSKLPGLVFKDVAVGTLQFFVFRDQRATNTTKVQLMRDVANGLAFSHDREVNHRNLRANNILVDIQDGNLVALLSDFGSGHDFEQMIHVENSTSWESLHWTAPERWRLEDVERINGAEDMWAFGCTMVEVLARTWCVWPADYRDYITSALKSGKRPPRPATFPPWDEAWNFIHDRCWVFDPAERITAREAVVELEALLKTVPPSM